MFILPGFGRFVSRGYTTAIPSGPEICPAHLSKVRDRLVHAVLCRGTYIGQTLLKHLSVSVVGTHYNSGALIPECNGLSQFREDTGESSALVPEFNLTACPLVQWR